LYFRGSNPEHAEVECRLSIPPQFADRTPELLVRDIEAMIQNEQRSIRAARGGAPVLSVKAVLAVSPWDSPKGPRERKHRVPTVKAGSNSPAYRIAIAAVRAYREAYRAALRCLRAGQRPTFPGGTLQLRERFAVECSGADFSWCCVALATVS
jgi:hypothetical protein